MKLGKKHLWQTDQNGMSNSYRGPSIDASYHILVPLAKLFQSRRFLEGYETWQEAFMAGPL
jgi:hypothetical protein